MSGTGTGETGSGSGAGTIGSGSGAAGSGVVSEAGGFSSLEGRGAPIISSGRLAGVLLTGGGAAVVSDEEEACSGADSLTTSCSGSLCVTDSVSPLRCASRDRSDPSTLKSVSIETEPLCPLLSNSDLRAASNAARSRSGLPLDCSNTALITFPSSSYSTLTEADPSKPASKASSS